MLSSFSWRFLALIDSILMLSLSNVAILAHNNVRELTKRTQNNILYIINRIKERPKTVR